MVDVTDEEFAEWMYTKIVLNPDNPSFERPWGLLDQDKRNFWISIARDTIEAIEILSTPADDQLALQRAHGLLLIGANMVKNGSLDDDWAARALAEVGVDDPEVPE
jgi:hypothetical protein